MARVTVEDCLEHTEGIFALVKVASKRARRIANGSETLLEEEQNETHETFGGEYLNFVAFQDEASVFIDSIMEKVPENMKEAAYKHTADFLNLLASSDELAGKLDPVAAVADPCSGFWRG